MGANSFISSSKKPTNCFSICAQPNRFGVLRLLDEVLETCLRALALDQPLIPLIPFHPLYC
jgi:hypothetical protein